MCLLPSLLHLFVFLIFDSTLSKASSSTSASKLDKFIDSDTSPYQVYVWQTSKSSEITDDSWKSFPESVIPTVRDYPHGNNAFHCSGGGTRAFTNCVGVFRAFHLPKNNLVLPRFLFGISGGTWFSFLYSFLPTSTSADDLEILSGVETGPNPSYQSDVSKLTLDFLNRQPDRAKEMLSAPTNKLWWNILSELFLKENPFEYDDWRFVWQNALYMVFLRPFGIGKDDSFAWDENFPHTTLPNTTYRFVRPNRPYPIVGTTYVTLKDLSELFPEPLGNR